MTKQGDSPRSSHPKIGIPVVVLVCSVFAVAGALTFVSLSQQAHVPTVLVDGNVYLFYPGSTPTNLTFSSQDERFSAIVSTNPALTTCGCGGYNYRIDLPNHQTYSVDVYYENSTGVYVCHTNLTVATGNDMLNEDVGCT